jgi:hypothetical protein
VARFAVNYMHREAGFHRFFLMLSLFAAAMLLLVMSGNAVLDLCRLGSRRAVLLSADFVFPGSAHRGGKRHPAFVTNRIGDAGFLLGVALSFHWLGGTDWQTMTAGAAGLSSVQAGVWPAVSCWRRWLNRPRYRWRRGWRGPWRDPRPPAPCSTARLWFMPACIWYCGCNRCSSSRRSVMAVMAVVGLATALYGFLAGLAQTDIKSALIFSTSGQVGLMFLACGLGFWRLGAGASVQPRGLSRLSVSQRARDSVSTPGRAHPPGAGPGSPGDTGLYTAALQRFWLEDLANWAIVRPVHRWANSLSAFDTAVVDRATGLPAPTVKRCRRWPSGRSANSAPGDCWNSPARPPPEIKEGRDQGIVGRVTEWIAGHFTGSRSNWCSRRSGRAS